MEHLYRYLAVTAVILSITGCGDAGVFTRRWTEEVALDNGHVITIERSVQVRETNSWSGDAYNAAEQEVTLSFTGDLSHLPAWSVPLTALVLYQDPATDEWVIVATTRSCEVMYERGYPRYWYGADRPSTSYFEFRLRKSGWIQVPLSPTSIGRETNLLFRYKTIDTSRVPLSAKQPKPSSDPKYLQVLERPEYTCEASATGRLLWSVEDAVLQTLEQKQATPEQVARVGELLVATRILYVSPRQPKTWKQDADPHTVEIVAGYDPAKYKPGVSEDGQVIYRVLASDEEQFLRESYARRFRAAGLEPLVGSL